MRQRILLCNLKLDQVPWFLPVPGFLHTLSVRVTLGGPWDFPKSGSPKVVDQKYCYSHLWFQNCYSHLWFQKYDFFLYFFSLDWSNLFAQGFQMCEMCAFGVLIGRPQTDPFGSYEAELARLWVATPHRTCLVVEQITCKATIQSGYPSGSRDVVIQS